jgi:hypothetical protein
MADRSCREHEVFGRVPTAEDTIGKLVRRPGHTKNQNDTRTATAATPSAALYDLAIAESDGGVGVELMLVALQASVDGAVVAAIVIIALLIWALSH